MISMFLLRLLCMCFLPSLGTGNQLYSQPTGGVNLRIVPGQEDTGRRYGAVPRMLTRRRQPVIFAAHAQATSYTRSPCTGNQLYTQPSQPSSTGNQLYSQPRYRQPVIFAAKGQATSYTGSSGAGNQLYSQPRHRQPVILADASKTLVPQTCLAY